MNELDKFIYYLENYDKPNVANFVKKLRKDYEIKKQDRKFYEV